MKNRDTSKLKEVFLVFVFVFWHLCLELSHTRATGLRGRFALHSA